jgi:hypothetical protein
MLEKRKTSLKNGYFCRFLPFKKECDARVTTLTLLRAKVVSTKKDKNNKTKKIYKNIKKRLKCKI